MASDRKFSRTDRDKYTLEEKNALGKLCITHTLFCKVTKRVRVIGF